MNFKVTPVLITVALLLVLLTAVIEAAPHDDHCDCHYQPDKKGCIISQGPTTVGFKCRCRISRFFLITHCVGTKIQCSSGEICPAGCSSKECCQLAGGDCNGY